MKELDESYENYQLHRQWQSHMLTRWSHGSPKKLKKKLNGPSNIVYVSGSPKKLKIKYIYIYQIK
jgi:hypothetical protein